jgi:hypothetical protein
VEREMAGQLSELLEIKPGNTEETATTKLPLVYSLKLPSIGNHDPTVPNHAIHPGDVLHDSTDPLEMIRPHEVEIERLSRVTDIPLENLLERTVVLMRSIKPESDWNRAAEERIRGWLSDIGLKLAYNRQRPQVALHAISWVVAELADSGMLDDDALAAAYDGLSLYDWRLADLEPQVRPKSIRKPDMPESFSSRDGWANNHEEVFSFFVDYLDDGFAVVGELSRFKEWDWKVPTELRLAMACCADWPVLPDDEVSTYRFFLGRHNWKAKDYPMLPRPKRLPSLVVHGYPRQELVGASEWLAFNPAVAIQLGWYLHKDGVFRWVDEDGQIMVESRWWQDGPMDRQPPRTREVTGEGWLVVASTKAQAIIQNNISSLGILRAVKRSVGKDDQENPLASYGWRIDQWEAKESEDLRSTE